MNDSERCDMMIDEIYELQVKLAKTEWRSVKNPPKKEGNYLTTREEELWHNVCISYFCKSGWNKNNVTAWMPLPEAYEEEVE